MFLQKTKYFCVVLGWCFWPGVLVDLFMFCHSHQTWLCGSAGEAGRNALGIFEESGCSGVTLLVQEGDLGVEGRPIIPIEQNSS